MLISSYHIKSLVQEFHETSYRTLGLHSKHKSNAESEISRPVGSAMFAEELRSYNEQQIKAYNVAACNKR